LRKPPCGFVQKLLPLLLPVFGGNHCPPGQGKELLRKEVKVEAELISLILEKGLLSVNSFKVPNSFKIEGYLPHLPAGRQVVT
jgi:hypothetical protein